MKLMNTKTLILSLLIHLTILTGDEVIPVDCVVREGPHVQGYQVESSVSCLNAETLVSCGIDGAQAIGGTWIDSSDTNTCIAMSNHPSHAAASRARCCTFPEGIILNTSIAETSSGQNGTVICSLGELTGCQTLFTSGSIDKIRGMGAGPEKPNSQSNTWVNTNNQCNGYSHSGGEIKTGGVCLELATTYELQCTTKSTKTNYDNFGKCPDGTFMSSCMTYISGSGTLDGYYITTNDKCFVQKDGNLPLWANAICCKLVYSDELILRLKDESIGYFNSSILTTGIENINNISANTYSIIGTIDYFKYLFDDGKYKFRLRYSNIDGSNSELIWKQSSWIIESNITGYEAISLTPDETVIGCQQFNGLGLSQNSTYCWIDGNALAPCFWNCIGNILDHPTMLLPGYNGMGAKSEELYITPTKYELILRLKDTTVGFFSSNLSQTGLENENNIDANTYSIIGYINQYRDYYDNKFKFKLVYINEDTSVDILIWKQSSWLTEENITDYEPIHVANDSSIFVETQFEGLGLSNIDASAWFDGNGGKNSWWNAVGNNKPYLGNDNGPGFRMALTVSQSLYIYNFGSTASPTNAPTQSPSLVPSQAPSYLPSNAPSSAPTQSPSNVPSQQPSQVPSKSPSQQPSQVPSNAPSLAPSSAPTQSPSHVPSQQPSQVPSNAPSQPPSSAPTQSPSNAPSNIPTQPPSRTPSQVPSIAPTLAPSNSPTSCIDYDISYNSMDGIDLVDKIEFTEEMNVEYSASNIIQYTSNETNHFMYETIACNNTNINASICFIGCYQDAQCLGLQVIPQSKLVDLKLICADRYSCRDSLINITFTAQIDLIENINIICLRKLSCVKMVININTTYNNQLTVHCVEELSCEDLTINLYDNHPLNANITCYSDNSCDGLQIHNIDNSDNIYINLLVYRYSADVLIKHQFLSNINFICGWFNDSRYIRYETDQLLDNSELLKLAQKEFESRKLPCQDIEVECTANIEEISRECSIEYQLIANLSKILNGGQDKDINCYWLDISHLYLPLCAGNCNQTVPYYTYNITFDLNLEIQDEQKIIFCEEFFGNENTTIDTLNSIDAIFEYVLDIKVSDSRIIKNIINDPFTKLRDNVTMMDCDAIQYVHIINLTTNITVESLKSEDDVLKEFSPGSVFINNCRKLLEDFFDVSLVVVLDTDTEIDIKDIGVFKDEYVYAIIIGSVLGFIIILVISILCYKKIQNISEKKAIYITNPMVISISIGEYAVKPTPDDIDNIGGQVENIPVDIDYEHINSLCSVLNYSIHTRYDDDGDVNIYWTMNDIMEFLTKKAADLDKNREKVSKLNKYDGLLVFVSCHGLEGSIITSDYKKIEKTGIHRLFSTQHPLIREIPRMFIFDCCAGDDKKSSNLSRVQRLRTSSGGQLGGTRLVSTRSKSLHGEDDENDEDDIDIDEKDNALDNNKDITKNIQLKQIHNTQSKWRVGENNPDYGLVEIHAANVGFQSKMDLEEGSYLIREFIQKLKLNINDKDKKNRFIFEIFDDIQEQLHRAGKQHIATKYNDGTRYLRFRKNLLNIDTGKSGNTIAVDVEMLKITKNDNQDMDNDNHDDNNHDDIEYSTIL